MVMAKIKVEDTVIVLAGKDKGRTGKVIKRAGPNRLLVEGVNMMRKHVRGNPQTNTEGGILDREASIHISNLAIYNPVSKKADRVGIKTLDDGRKVRFYKSDNEIIDI